MSALITMDLDGTETIDSMLLGGADNITVNDLTGTDVNNVNIDLGAAGGGGDVSEDTVVAQRDRRRRRDQGHRPQRRGHGVRSGQHVTISNFEAGDHLVINVSAATTNRAPNSLRISHRMAATE